MGWGRGALQLMVLVFIMRRTGRKSLASWLIVVTWWGASHLSLTYFRIIELDLEPKKFLVHIYIIIIPYLLSSFLLCVPPPLIFFFLFLHIFCIILGFLSGFVLSCLVLFNGSVEYRIYFTSPHLRFT